MGEGGGVVVIYSTVTRKECCDLQHSDRGKGGVIYSTVNRKECCDLRHSN